MKKMTFRIMAVALLLSASAPGCKTITEPEIPTNASLKSAGMAIEPACQPTTFGLMTRQMIPMGEMVVSNDNKYLQVVIDVMPPYVAENVKLWIGVPSSRINSNRKGLPVPEKFKIKVEGEYENVFLIGLSDIYSIAPGANCNEKEIVIFAQVLTDNTKTEESDEIMVWSEGGEKCMYTTCCKTGGGGCFPHDALGGNALEKGISYYDNTSGGQQNITADNSEIAGWVKYDSGVLTFSFNQDWMFSEQQPLLEIQGLNDKVGKPVPLSIDEPASTMGVYSVSIPFYPYYLIKYKLQFCTTEN